VKWLGLVVLATLPLQWFVVGSTPLGLMRLHQAILLLATALLLVVRPWRTNLPLMRTATPFVVLNVVMLTLWTGMSAYNGDVPRTQAQEVIYLVVFVVFGTYLARAASGAEPGALVLLRWAAVAAAVTLVLAFSVSMLGNGVNPVAVLQRTIASADPELLQKELFRSSFTGYGYDSETVRGNIRHEVFGAVLLAMYVSVWAEGLAPGNPGWGRFIRRAGLVACTGLLILSMSRAVLIAAAVWPLVSVMRSVRTYTVSRRQLTVLYGALAGVGLLVVTGVGRVIWVRFTQDTTSYQSRGGLYDQAWAQIRQSLWTGGVETTGESSHNFVVDAWLRGGMLVAIAAGAILLLLFVDWGALLVRLPREPLWMVPVAAAFALPIDRMLTAGGGLIPPVSWMTLALIAGAFTYRRTLADPAGRPSETVPVAVSGPT
jgi:hypothetical protein